MPIPFEISEQDYVNAVKLSAQMSRRQAYMLLFAWIILLAMAVFISTGVLLGVLFGPIGGAVVAWLWLHVVVAYIARRHYRKYKLMQGKLAAALHEDGVQLKTDDSDAILHWDKLLKWRQNNQFVLLYQMPALFFIIPKRLEAEGFDVPLLLQRLTETLGPAK
jgi:membrane-anchored glycerophosphoryl diester phosphodiesterase (GDPDase)